MPAGSGTEEDPYQIGTIDNLVWISENSEHWDKHYVQTADIDASGVEWSPIGGPLTTQEFTGTYDACRAFEKEDDKEHDGRWKIQNLHVTGTTDIGLFGRIAGATISNLILENVTIEAENQVGGLVGYSKSGVIYNIKITGNINSSGSDTGGLAGRISSGHIHNISSYVNVDGGNRTGGLIGQYGSGAILWQSYSAGSVIGTEEVGGLIGCSYYVVPLIIDCYSNANVTGDSKVGGFIGNNKTSYIIRSFSTGSVNGGDNTGGFIGISDSENMTHYCYWDINTSGQTSSAGGDGVKGLTTSEMQMQDNYKTYNFAVIWEIDEGNSYAVFRTLSGYGEPDEIYLEDLQGTGTENDPYIITDASELHAVRQDLEAHYMLGNDIDLSSSRIWNNGRGWEPIGDSSERFTGSLDGCGFRISNLYIIVRSISNQGIFGYIDNATIKNLILDNSYLVAGPESGNLAGVSSSSSIYNISVTGCIVSLYGYLGGVIGQSFSSTIGGISFEGQVLNYGAIMTSYTGGIIGKDENSELNEVYVNAEVYSTISHVGGLVGQSSGTYVNNLTIKGKITSEIYTVGGLAGKFTGGEIQDVSVNAEVKGTNKIGGLVGELGSNMQVSRAYSAGTVNGVNEVGGLIGLSSLTNTAITNCYSSSSVYGDTNVGGFIGNIAASTVTVSDSYSRGMVDGTGENIGGFIGSSASSSISFCYWDTESSGQEQSAGGDGVMGRTADEMTYPHSADTYEGWDFAEVWSIGQELNQGYPYLRCKVPYLHTVALSVDPKNIDVVFTGGGEYEEGVRVDISVQLARDYSFLEWTGDYADLLDDPLSESTFFTMPGNDVVFTAVYADDSEEYNVTLFSDPSDIGVLLTGEGDYAEGETVSISAPLFHMGYVFIEWTGDNSDLLDDPSSSMTFFTMPGYDLSFIAVFEEETTDYTSAVISIENESDRGIYLWNYIDNKTAWSGPKGSEFVTILENSAASKMMTADITGDGLLDVIANIYEMGLWYYIIESNQWHNIADSSYLCNEFTLAKTTEAGPHQVIASFENNGLFKWTYNGAWESIIQVKAETLAASDINNDASLIDELLVTFAGYEGFYIYDFTISSFTRILMASPSQIIGEDITGDGYNEIVCVFDGVGIYLVKYTPSKTEDMKAHARWISEFDLLNDIPRNCEWVYNNRDSEGFQFNRITLATPDPEHHMAIGDIEGNNGNEIIFTYQNKTYYYSYETGEWNTLIELPLKRIICGNFTGNVKDDLIACITAPVSIYLRESSSGIWEQIFANGNTNAMTALE